MFPNFWLQNKCAPAVASKFMDFSISCVWSHVVDGSGMAWSVGDNSNRTLGDNTTDPSLSYVAVCCDICFCRIESGESGYTIAQTPTGQLYSWGSNSDGQLGDGTTTARSMPVPVCCDYCYTDYSLGKYHVVAIRCDGTTIVWGSNYWCNLGDNGSGGARCVPSAIVCGGHTFCKVSAADGHTLAIKTDGTAVGWGCNGAGDLGDGTTTTRGVPTAVCCDYCYCEINAGQSSSHGILRSGLAVAWGSGWPKGDGLEGAGCVPSAVCCNYCYKCIVGSSYMAVGLTQGGVLYAWGQGWQGGLGNCDGGFQQNQPIAVCSACTFCKVKMHNGQILAETTDQKLYAWGNNECGMLGLGDTDNRCVPTLVSHWE
jgi:alpha-tubulin suppressor-like RCC1 family protein